MHDSRTSCSMRISFFGYHFVLDVTLEYDFLLSLQLISSIQIFIHSDKVALHKKWSFPLRISSVNVIKSEVSFGFANIYWRNPEWKTSFSCSEGVTDQYSILARKTAGFFLNFATTMNLTRVLRHGEIKFHYFIMYTWYREKYFYEKEICNHICENGDF